VTYEDVDLDWRMDLFAPMINIANYNHAQGEVNLHPSGVGLPSSLPASVANARGLGFTCRLFDLLLSGSLLELQLLNET
jgi:hypothetical protein